MIVYIYLIISFAILLFITIFTKKKFRIKSHYTTLYVFAALVALSFLIFLYSLFFIGGFEGMAVAFIGMIIQAIGLLFYLIFAIIFMAKIKKA